MKRGSTNQGNLDIPATTDTPPEPAAEAGAGQNIDAKALLSAVAASLDDAKAEDVVVIDLSGKTSIADYMVIACGTSQRHVGSMTTRLRQDLKAFGVKAVSVEGETHCDWVLVDAGDVVVHLFRPEVRAFYALERLWGAAPMVAASGSAGEPALST